MHVARAGAAMVAAALAVPGVAHAESFGGTGQGGLSAPASINFKTVVPESLALKAAQGATVRAGLAFEPSSTVVRGARGGNGLSKPSDITLRNNMREVTIVRESGGRPTVTVIAP